MSDYAHPDPVLITQQVYVETVVPWQKLHEAAMDAQAKIMRRFLERNTDEQIISGNTR